MKILLLTDRMDVGGAETHIALLARMLRSGGDDVTLLSEGGRTALALRAEGIRTLRMPLSTHNPLRLISARRALKKLVKREKYDVIHAHARICAFLMRGLGKYGGAEIVTVHARFKSNVLLRRLCYWGMHTIAVSEDLRAYVCDTYAIPAEQVHVIPNGIDCARFAPENATRCEENAPLRILFASRLDRDCALGARLLCRVAPVLLHRFPTLEISIAGGGDAKAEIAALALEANAAAGREAITLLGTVSDMASLLPHQDIFIGVSRAAMEAAACGCAVILCGNEGYMGILNAANADEAALSNLCCRRSPTAEEGRLLSDLLLLLEHPSVRIQYANEGRAAVLAHFDGCEAYQKTRQLYRTALPPKGNCRITVGGYFGGGNVGDDLILQGFLAEVRQKAPDLRVCALSAHPRRVAHRFSIPCYARKNPFSLAYALLSSDAFLCGGGSLLQNATSNRSLSYYLHLLRFSRFWGKLTVLYAAGIGPLRGTHATQKVAKTLSRCQYISLREAHSRNLARRIGLDPALLHEGADPALLLPPPPDTRADFLLREIGMRRSDRYFCIVLKGGRATDDACRITVAAARMIAKRHGLHPVFLIFDRVRDTHATRVSAAALHAPIPTLREGADALALLSHAQFCVTMRLHAMILSTAAATPSLGVCTLSDDQKIPAFAKESANRAIPLESLGVGAMVEQMEQLLHSRASLRPVLRNAAADLRKKAQKDLENILSMLYNSR